MFSLVIVGITCVSVHSHHLPSFPEEGVVHQLWVCVSMEKPDSHYSPRCCPIAPFKLEVYTELQEIPTVSFVYFMWELDRGQFLSCYKKVRNSLFEHLKMTLFIFI